MQAVDLPEQFDWIEGALAATYMAERLRIIAFVLEREVIDRILTRVGEPTEPPAIFPAPSPPQDELDFSRAVAGSMVLEVGGGWIW